MTDITMLENIDDVTMFNPNDPEWLNAYIDYEALDNLDTFWYNNKEFIDYLKWKDYEAYKMSITNTES